MSSNDPNYAKKYYKLNRNKILAYHQKWYAKNKKRIALKNKLNKATRSTNAKKWYAKNKKQVTTASKKYYKLNRGFILNKNKLKHRAKMDILKTVQNDLSYKMKQLTIDQINQKLNKQLRKLQNEHRANRTLRKTA